MMKFKQFVNERCWPGYKPTPGKKAYSKGSCMKEDGVPVNTAGGGSVAGIGVGPQGEPGGRRAIMNKMIMKRRKPNVVSKVPT